jgi:glycosyltransferase involved in cell wall biosynthesis
MITRVGVVVPAHDEQDLIVGCLESLLAAVHHLRITSAGRMRSDIVVVLDNCRDATSERVAAVAGVTAIVAAAGSVGAARRAGVARFLEEAPNTLLIASTDADSRVPRDWLSRLVEHANHGADLVLGTVRPFPELPEPLHSAWLAAHHLGDGHPHVHGANLAIRASSYVDLGGWSPLHTREDVDLVVRAERAGLPICRCGDVVVRTSSRKNSRVPHGFSTYLRNLDTVDAGTCAPPTSSADRAACRWPRRERARAAEPRT